MEYFKKLVGDRIYLSPSNAEDVEKYTKWLNDFYVTDGLGRSGKIMTVAEERKWLENANKNGDVFFAIVKLENNELIGNCGIHDINHQNRTATIGILIGEENNRNNGFGAETLRLLLDYGFHYLNLNNIMLNVFSFNERAIACYKKVGFKEFGRRRKSYFLNGKYYDSVHMDILAEEFTEDYIKNKNI